MSEETKEKKVEVAAAPKAAKSSPIAIVLTAVLAAGGAFGGAKIAAAHQAPASASAEAKTEPQTAPGPTANLQPFLVIADDDQKKPHPIKITLAIEFSAGAKAEEVKELTPRIRDAVLTYLRSATYDDLTNPKLNEKTRAEILEKVQHSGATEADRVLITDFVVQ